MEKLVLLIMILAEAGLCFCTITRKSERKHWLLHRLLVSSGELLAYLLMVILPGVDFSFRFRGLFVILLLRIAVEGSCYFVKRKKTEGIKRAVGAAVSALLGVVLLAGSLVPAFVFRDYNGRPVTGDYAAAHAQVILVDASREENFEADGSKREVPVHFFYPENADITNCPLVLFSHGAFGYYQSNMSTYQELVSHGYVVISLDHPYHSFFTTDTAGKTITADPQFMNDVFGINEETATEQEIYEISQTWMEIRCADINFVLDTVKEAAGSGAFSDAWFFNENEKEEISRILEMTDCDKIGVMGHSMGGAASVSVGRQRDDISAVVDLDGTMLGEQIGYENSAYVFNQEPYPVPILSIDNEEHHLDAQQTGSGYVNNVVLGNAVDSYNVYFKGAAHMNFTDLPLFAPSLAAMLGTGTIDSTHCIDTMNQIVLSYMDHYLKGKGELNLKEYYE